MNNQQNPENPVLACQDLVREFKQGPDTLRVVNQVNLTIQPGEQVAIVGSSGSGKTTLLHLLGGLDRPTSGTVFLQQQPLHQLREKQRCQLRNQSLGFVYQFHHLLPEFTALENVAMPLLIGKQAYKNAIEKAKTLLEAVGLSQRYRHKMAQLSGGERQRVAIARALVNNPACVLADEPTGNLDSHTANRVYDLMQQLHRDYNTAFVLVTHDYQLAKRMDTIYTLDNGMLQR